MKTGVVVLLFALAYVECYPKKLLTPLSKTANIDFINMEGGGAPRQPVKPVPAPAPAPAKPAQPASVTAKPAQPAPITAKPLQPATVKPAVQPAQAPAKLAPVQPNVKPAQPTPYPALPAKSVTTPGPGSVKQLITFYDSQGKASVIRPHTYSQAVKQG